MRWNFTLNFFNHAHLHTYAATEFCGDILHQTSGVIAFPENGGSNFSIANGSLVDDRRCAWMISTDTNRKIALGMIMNQVFTIDERDCLSVYDGPSNTSPVLVVYCSSNAGRYFQTVYSTGRHLYMELVSTKTGVSQSSFTLRYVTFLTGKYVFFVVFVVFFFPLFGDFGTTGCTHMGYIYIYI